MTSIDRFLPGPRTVIVVAPDRASPLSTLGPLEVFDMANRYLAARSRPPLYRSRLASLEGSVVSSVGVALAADPLERIDEVHTLIVGGGPELPDQPLDPGLVGEVGRLAGLATRVVSVCGGAFVLGALGLLAGRRCTTHWLWVDALGRRFPEARVDPDAIYTEDGPIWTSAGITAGVDLALQLVRRDGGPGLAQAVARGMVMFVQRPGGQAQYGAALRLGHGLDDRLQALVAAVVSDPGAALDVPSLARRLGMSPRNFARVFRRQTGVTPAAFVARARIEAAQRALADTDTPLATVAADCGFGTEATLRRTFARVVGVSPGAWRERFSRGAG